MNFVAMYPYIGTTQAHQPVDKLLSVGLEGFDLMEEEFGRPKKFRSSRAPPSPPPNFGRPKKFRELMASRPRRSEVEDYLVFNPPSSPPRRRSPPPPHRRRSEVENYLVFNHPPPPSPPPSSSSSSSSSSSEVED